MVHFEFRIANLYSCLVSDLKFSKMAGDFQQYKTSHLSGQTDPDQARFSFLRFMSQPAAISTSIGLRNRHKAQKWGSYMLPCPVLPPPAPPPPAWYGSKTYILATFSWNPPKHMVFTMFWQAWPPKPWYLQRFVILHCILLFLYYYYYYYNYYYYYYYYTAPQPQGGGTMTHPQGGGGGVGDAAAYIHYINVYWTKVQGVFW